MVRDSIVKIKLNAGLKKQSIDTRVFIFFGAKVEFNHLKSLHDS